MERAPYAGHPRLVRRYHESEGDFRAGCSEGRGLPFALLAVVLVLLTVAVLITVYSLPRRW